MSLFFSSFWRLQHASEINLLLFGRDLVKINIKNCRALFKKVVIGRAVTALKQQKSKGKGKEKGIAEIVHLMKPITRSPQ
jgi:hypothetical protein